MQVTHHHIIGTLAAATAFIAFMSSPKAQHAVERYLILIQREVVQLAHELRNTAHQAVGRTGLVVTVKKRVV